MTLSTPTTLSSYSPAEWYRLSQRNNVLMSLVFLSLLGAFGTWGLARSNGLMVSIDTLVSQDRPEFPGTEALLLKSYTSINFVDYQLSSMVAFMSHLLDFTHGEMSLFGLHGFGQLGAAWTLMMMENMRMGNRARTVSMQFVAIAGCLFQTLSFAVVVPLWLLLHILISPVAKPFPGAYANKVLLVPIWDLWILPISITLGFITPAGLMLLPSPGMISPSTRQKYITVWQAFYAWSVGIHWSLKTLCRFVVTKMTSDDSSKRPPTPQGASYLSNVKYVYRFVLAMCLSTHLPVVIIAVLPTWMFPSRAPTLAFLGSSNLFDVFVPYFPLPSYQVSSLAEGVHTFLIWDLYIGEAAFLLWALFLYRNATTERSIVDTKGSLPVYKEILTGSKSEDMTLWKKVLGQMAVWTLISGPMGALTILLWERDTIVRQKIKQGL